MDAILTKVFIASNIRCVFAAAQMLSIRGLRPLYESYLLGSKRCSIIACNAAALHFFSSNY